MLGERVERAVELAANGPIPERIGAMGRAYVEFACAHTAHFRIMFRPELVNLDNCPSAQAEGANAFATVIRVVHEAVEAGLPARPSEGALVATLWSTVHGLACLILDGPLAKKMPDANSEEQIDGVIAAMQSMLEASLRRG
jgi:AcrR family transcriptional regulator